MRHFTIIQSLLEEKYADANVKKVIEKGKELLGDTEKGEYATEGGKEEAIKKCLAFEIELIGMQQQRGAMQCNHLAIILMNTGDSDVPPEPDRSSSVAPDDFPGNSVVETPKVELPPVIEPETHTADEMKMDEQSEKEFNKAEKGKNKK